MYQPENAKAPYVPPNIILPEDWQEARVILTDYFIKVADAVNSRELGFHIDASLDSSNNNLSATLTGQTWFKDNEINTFRYPFRTVVNITSGLQNFSAGVQNQTQAHGITCNENTRFTKILGVATSPTASSITRAMTIPHADPDNLADSIEVAVDATNVILRYGADYSAFTAVYIILEWLE